MAAERNYQVFFQTTNWPPDELTYQAQLMAGRAAVARQGWKDAKAYFTQLYNNTNGLPKGPSLDLRYQALFEHALALIRVADPADTNRLANLEQATIALGRICDDYPPTGWPSGPGEKGPTAICSGRWPGSNMTP